MSLKKVVGKLVKGMMWLTRPDLVTKDNKIVTVDLKREPRSPADVFQDPPKFSSMFCEHANECPISPCQCPVNCTCRRGWCKDCENDPATSNVEGQQLTSSSDRLQQWWDQQLSFMELLKEKRNFPNFPVDLTSKEGQKFVKTISYECADELAEARQHLKNKDHRATVINEIDRAEYVEELSDAMHYLIEIVIASGISLEEFHEAYLKKGHINVERIRSGY